jgi:hypothetical protein
MKYFFYGMLGMILLGLAINTAGAGELVGEAWITEDPKDRICMYLNDEKTRFYTIEFTDKIVEIGGHADDE